MAVFRRTTKEDRLIDGSREFTNNQLSLLILYSMVKRAAQKEKNSYPRFRIRESQIAELNQKPLTPESRWGLVESMNNLGYEVAINHKYWIFTKSSLTDSWPAFPLTEIDGFLKRLRPLTQHREMGCLGEEDFFNHDAKGLDLFYNGTPPSDDCYDEYDEEYEEEQLDDYNFTVWQHIYYHLELAGAIDDPLLLKKE
ncbi:hypothetical protein BIZ37_16375 [Photobacterium sp. BZF1]|uniref:hypothetical protein n=1 Tax=Photobacterium sp. BZF1 TaxID=1904457 RepID=UPI0016537F68|nr:hypothetical protein [Photobacterium sp. BZF1]MBC7004140.1 hypothetical protein [Photobacterium sp. BZF1]